jgi:hypothetical protein
MLRISAVAILTAVLFAGQGGAGQDQSQASPPPTAQTETPSASTAQTGTPPTVPTHGKHTVTLTFDYDFRKTPACTTKLVKGCIEEFVAYDISAGAKHRLKLFEIPLPSKPEGLVQGISATSPLLDFESGKHRIAVVARETGGIESHAAACTTWIVIP